MTLTDQEISRLVNRYIGVDSGYLGDFTYRSHTDFYPEYCDIHDVYPDEILGTTRQRFISILGAETTDRQAKILRGVLSRFPADSAIRQGFKPTVERWIQRLEGSPAVQAPTPEPSMLAVVRQSLVDAENLIAASGPASAVDRVHTALHGHIVALCAESGIELTDRASLQAAMKQLRERHPALVPSGPRANEVSRVLYSMAATLDALTTLRNNASAAHPNEDLLGRPEALLAINAARTIFSYVDDKVRPAQ